MNVYWIKFNRYLYKYWRLQTAVIVLGFIVAVLSLVNPYLTKLVIDKAYMNKNLGLFFILAAVGGSVFILSGLVSYLSEYCTQRIYHAVHFDITRDIFRHLQGVPLRFFDNASTGELVYKMSNDIETVSDFVCTALPQMIKVVLRIICIVVIVFIMNWRLALLALLLVPLCFIHPYFFGKWLKELTYRVVEQSQVVFERLHEVFAQMHLVQALGKQDYEIDRFEKAVLKRKECALKRAKISSASHFSGSTLNKIIGGVIALYGGYQVIKGTLTLGELSAIMIYFTQLLGLVRSSAQTFEAAVISSVSAERLDRIFAIKPQIQNRQKAIEYCIKSSEISFDNVSFGYTKDRDVLKNMSFVIPAASKIALVGPSGCGKTTLLNLILRLYEIRAGSILIEGMNTQEIMLQSLRVQIGIALQEPFLFNDSVANNILYGAENATEEDLIRASRIAEAHDFIMQLPAQYNSVVGEMACKISEGQKQRIAIARAVIKKPKILILDEAMSSVDSKIEEKIIDNIKNEFKDSTVIIVSHRLSAVKKMELVYFLETANKMTIASHTGIIAQNKNYQALFRNQLKSTEDVEILL